MWCGGAGGSGCCRCPLPGTSSYQGVGTLQFPGGSGLRHRLAVGLWADGVEGPVVAVWFWLAVVLVVSGNGYLSEASLGEKLGELGDAPVL